MFRKLGMFGDAEDLMNRVLELCKEILGDRHSDTICVMNNLATTILKCGRLEEAEDLHKKVLELHKETRSWPFPCHFYHPSIEMSVS